MTISNLPVALFVVNVDWYFLSHRLPLALALKGCGFDVAVVTAEERCQGGQIEAAGLRYIRLPLRRGSMNVLEEAVTFASLLRVYRAERPVLVHHVTIKPVLYGSVAARVAGVPAIANAIPGRGHVFGTGGGAAQWARPAVRLLYRIAFSHPRCRVIFQNAEDRDYFVQNRLVKSSQAVVVPGAGVDVQAFSPSPEPPGTPIVIMASRLLWNKGVGEFVEAIDLLKSQGVACRGVIVGVPDTQNPRAVPESILKQWSNEGRIEWWGLRGDMPDVLRQAAVVTLPTYYPEGVPKILIEGAATGRCLVATATPGCRDIVNDGKNGFLVPPRDSAALAAALRRLLEDPELRRRFGAESRVIACARFAEPFVISQTLDVYQELLAEAWPLGAQKLV